MSVFPILSACFEHPLDGSCLSYPLQDLLGMTGADLGLHSVAAYDYMAVRQDSFSYGLQLKISWEGSQNTLFLVLVEKELQQMEEDI